MERKHLCEMLVMERLISEEKESDLRKATQQLSKEQQQERLFELKVCTINLCYVLGLFSYGFTQRINNHLRSLTYFSKNLSDL